MPFLIFVDYTGICPSEGIHRLLCRLFRWPELSTGAELKRVINLCGDGHHQSTTTTICCNPYHWSRLSGILFINKRITSNHTQTSLKNKTTRKAAVFWLLLFISVNRKSLDSRLVVVGTLREEWCVFFFFQGIHILLCVVVSGGLYHTRYAFPVPKKKKKKTGLLPHTFAASAGVSRAGSKTSDDDDGGDGGGSVSAFDGYSLSGS